MTIWLRRLLPLAPLLLLTSCLLSPGKFTSTLDIRADRSFSFTYQGELIASSDPGSSISSSVTEDSSTDSATSGEDKTPAKPKDSSPGKDEDAKLRAIADALAKEEGFRSARYVGGRKFLIDYAISGRLDHGFVFPFNIDAQAVLPFLAIELRKDGKVRVQAPGFANASEKGGGMGSGMGSGMDDSAKALDGSFTLTTNAEIISQNQEDGATDSPRGKQIVWKVNSLTKTAPMAILRFK